MPGISIVFITCNNPLNVEKRLAELKGLPVEIIVIDDSQYLIAYPPGVVVDSHRGKRGAVHCLNIGIEKASNNIVILMGDDLEIPNPEGFIERLVWYFQVFHYPIVGFNVVDCYNLLRPPRFIEWLLWHFCGQRYSEQSYMNKYGKGLYSPVFAIDKSRTKKRYDEGYSGSGYNGDWDFLYGEQMVYAADLKVYHNHPDMPYSETVKRNKKMMMHNRGYFLKKHFRFPRVRLAFYWLYLTLMPVAEWIMKA